MEEKRLLSELKDYKKTINPVTRGTVTWKEGLLFEARTQVGYEFEMDGHVQWGCAPVESLLLSLAGCMGIDTVSFLQKMRVDLSLFKVEIAGERRPEPPQHYTSLEITLHAAGSGLTEQKMARAVALSHEKYCSVYHSLRDDLEVKLAYVILGAD